MMEFTTFWSLVQGNLHVGNVIPRWSRDSGYLPHALSILLLSDVGITISTPSALSTIFIPRGDFERVWNLWEAYIGGTLPRHHLRDLTRFSSYVISIIWSLQIAWLPTSDRFAA